MNPISKNKKYDGWIIINLKHFYIKMNKIYLNRMLQQLIIENITTQQRLLLEQ
jgi:hypothetical protein